MAWWGEQTFEHDQRVRWRIASLALWVRCAEREWLVGWDWPPDWNDALTELERDEDAAPPDEEVNVERHVLLGTDRQLRLKPATADRPIVAMPHVPFFIGPRAEARLYVGSPLWLRLEAGGQTLRELPIHRPSDTFFGPSTIRGEMCYATPSRATLDVQDLMASARHAATPVHIRNEASTALRVERLKLPVALLSIFSSGEHLWTECLDVIVGHEELATVSVRPGPPQEAAKGTLLTKARSGTGDSSPLMRIFDNLVSMSKRRI